MKRIQVLLLVVSSIIVIGLLSQSSYAGGIAVAGGLTHEATLQPGGTAEGKILLKNVSDVPRQVKLYQTDYQFSADGSTQYGEPGKHPRSNAEWVSFTPHELTIPPHKSSDVYYTVQVPSDNKLTGTYWSVIMVEPVTTEDPLAGIRKQQAVNVGVRIVTRYAIQMVTNIGDTGERNIKFLDTRVMGEPNKSTLRLDVENTGERWLYPTIWAEVFDSKGVSLGRKNGGNIHLHPGCSGRINVDLGQLPKGDYNALIIVDNGDDYVFGTQQRFSVTDLPETKVDGSAQLPSLHAQK